MQNIMPKISAYPSRCLYLTSYVLKMYNDPCTLWVLLVIQLGQQNSVSNMKSNICRKKQLHTILYKII
jgi:hypothetical protein